jgi:hypothetical protein
LIYGSTGGKQIGDRKVTDRMLVGFVGGGGQWLIEAVDPMRSSYWKAAGKSASRTRWIEGSGA